LGRARMETSISDAGVVLLDWEVTEDNGIAAFRIDRVYSDSAYTVATGIEPGSRSWTDSDVDRPGSLAYRLYATDLDGRDFFLSSVEVTIDTPIDYVLAQAYPNPFTSSANIRYFVRDEGYVKMDIVDSGGRMLSTIVNEFQEGDRWYHAALSGQGLATGVYFVHLLVEGYNGIAFEKVIPIALVR